MKHTKKFLAMLLILCTFASIGAGIRVTAAAPSKMSVADLAAASEKVATQVQEAIAAAPTSGGVRYDIAMPGSITVGAYTMGVEDYTLMAAQAICAVNEGNTSAIGIAYYDVSLTEDYAQGVNLDTVDKKMILDLAVRTMKYGVTLQQLPTSFIRPEGDTVYEGRICIWSVAYIFAQTLSAYAANGSLPVSVTFSPTSYTGSTSGSTPSAPAESTALPESTAQPETTAPTQASTAATTADWYAPVAKAAYELEQYVLKNKDLPSSVTVNGQTFNMAEFAYLCSAAIVGVNGGTTSGTLSTPSLSLPANPQDTLTPGSIQLAETVERAQKYMTFCDNNGKGPNYMTTSLGFLHFKEAVYFYAKNMSFYYEEGRLPNYCGVTNWAVTSGTYSEGDATFGVDYSAYSKYLVPTANCQSTNATIISVAKTGMYYSSGTYGGYANPSNTYQAIFNLFEYLNDKTSYLYYYDTLRGATGVWRDKQGNCCDMAHLMIACSRSLGVPGRYHHDYCHFATMSTGHVYAKILCGSTWYTADLVSNYNYLGYKTNTSAYQKSGPWAELPF